MSQRKILPVTDEHSDPWLMVNGLPLYLLEHELTHACSYKKANFTYIENLLALGLNINCRDDDGNTPLMRASAAGNAKLVQYLIDLGADVNAVNHRNETALKLACGKDSKIAIHLPVIEILLKNHADPNIVPNDGSSPLITCCYFSRIKPEKAVKLLLAAGANPELPDIVGNTPLMVAGWSNHVAVVRLLIEKNVKLDVVNKVGETALSYASHYQYDRDAVIGLLLKAGADYQVTDLHGRTPLDHYPAIAQMIEKLNKAKMTPSEGQSIRRQFSLFKVDLCEDDNQAQAGKSLRH